jgi:large subunit ribosomal protein L7/L12
MLASSSWSNSKQADRFVGIGFSSINVVNQAPNYWRYKVATKEEIIESIATMTVLDLADLVKALEAKFGVSAAAPMAMMAAGPAAAEAAPVAAPVEEQTEFDVVLKSVGDQKIQVIKVVRELTTLGLREAKEVVDGAPSTVLKAVTKEAAGAAKEKLEAVGAGVDVK